MNETITIRTEQEGDFRTVEEIVRNAFWNLYIPGCSEHYLAHEIRSHQDFLPELDLVIQAGHRIIGNIMYTKTRLVDESGNEKNILTFGPVCVLPEYQRKGYGKKLMEYSFRKAADLGYDLIVIFGSPSNYVCHGFKSCKKYNICLKDGTYPAPMMVKELRPQILDGRKWVYFESPAFKIDEQAARRFDESFEKMEEKFLPSQEEFYIYSNAVLP